MLLTGFAQLQTAAIGKVEVVQKNAFVTFKEYYPSVWGSNLTVLASPVRELLRQVWTPRPHLQSTEHAGYKGLTSQLRYGARYDFRQ